MAAGSAKAALRKLGIIHSHPNWMVSSWLAAFGEQDTVALMRHNNRCAAALRSLAQRTAGLLISWQAPSATWG
jgi:hypothetical protein